MEWDEVMVKISEGDVGRDSILDSPELEKAIKKVETKIFKKRNKRREFFRELLGQPNGMMWVFVLDRLRDEMLEKIRDAKHEHPGLNAVLSEWDEQKDSPQTNDTLTQVVQFSADYPLTFQCFAVVAHCRRIRKGSGVINENAEIAMRLVRDAQNTINIGGFESNEEFSITPSEHFRLAIDLQEVLCLSRFGDLEEVTEKANELESKIKKAQSKLKKFDHRPDANLLWWVYNVKLRCAALSFSGDLEDWLGIRKEMDKIEQIEATSGLTAMNKRRSTNKRNPDSIAYMRINAVNDLLKEWKTFHEDWRVNYDVRKRRIARGPHEKQLLKEVGERYGDFNFHLGVFKDFTHHFPTKFSIPARVKHAFSLSNEDRRRKSRNLFTETSSAVQSICLSNIFHTVHVLDILHRLLVYRLWWESIGYDDKVEKMFEKESILGLLRKIHKEIEQRHKGRSLEVEKTIETLKENISDHTDPRTVNETLGSIVEKWDKQSKKLEKKATVSESVMGLIFTARDSENKPKDPHRYIDPMMPAAGPKKSYSN